MSTMMIELVASLITVLIASLGVLRAYRRTGTFHIRQLPWKTLRNVVYAARRMYFTIHYTPSRYIDRPIGEVVNDMHADHFESGWYLSYNYEGEDENLRRPEGTMNGKNRQLHVRLWADGKRTGVDAHREYSALQHPKLHLNDTDMEDAADYIIQEYGN